VIDDAKLLAYFQRGLIPGPAESEEAFLRRAQKATPLDCAEWKEASRKTLPFQFSLDWVPLTYSSRKLAWWEGAATWISDDNLPLIQLHPRFNKGSFWGYDRSDVLAHEAVHAARMCFEEPQFEEILAYSTSPQAWKRFLGPLFSRTWEPLLLLLSLALGIFWPLVPLLVMGVGIGWLGFRQWIFKRCCRKLTLPVVLCLTDSEMRSFVRIQLPGLMAHWEHVFSLRLRLVRLLLRKNRDIS
jgi:hypothetical protein